ncbi:MAG TPA: hypothetical protein VD767_00445 [Thermomicrobiales bacterium]|nr:hypothetical protein [Thermomicrobiales bacterium]
MSKVRSFAPVLIAILVVALIGGLFAKRMADFGKDIHETAGRSR